MYTVSVESDLYKAGSTEDGVPFIAEEYYVLIENQAGKRFRHSYLFKGAVRSICPEDGFESFEDIREASKASAQAVADRVNAALAKGTKLNPECWTEIDPAYASDEYIKQNTEEKRWVAERVGEENYD